MEGNAQKSKTRSVCEMSHNKKVSGSRDLFMREYSCKGNVHASMNLINLGDSVDAQPLKSSAFKAWHLLAEEPGTSSHKILLPWPANIICSLDCVLFPTSPPTASVPIKLLCLSQLRSGSNGVIGYQLSQSSSLYGIERFCILLLHYHGCCSLNGTRGHPAARYVHHHTVPETLLGQYG